MLGCDSLLVYLSLLSRLCVFIMRPGGTKQICVGVSVCFMPIATH